MFRNLRFYRISESWPKTEQDLSERLSERAFVPCSAYSERSAGWEAPVETEQAALCRRIEDADLLQLRTQSRVLPPAVVREALTERVAEFRKRTGEAPNPGERRRLKEETRDDLLPRALVRSQRTRACFLRAESVLAIDAASPSQAEWLIDQLRPCFGRFNCRPLKFNTPPAEMIKRIFLGDAPGSFQLGRECRLQDPSDRQAVGAWRNIELADQAIRRHVIDGMKLTHLGIVFDHVISAVLSEDGVVSKLKIVAEEDEVLTWDQDPLALFDSNFALLAGTVRNLLGALKKQLGGFAT
jgi:recombination associated protein RdgC